MKRSTQPALTEQREFELHLCPQYFIIILFWTQLSLWFIWAEHHITTVHKYSCMHIVLDHCRLLLFFELGIFSLVGRDSEVETVSCQFKPYLTAGCVCMLVTPLWCDTVTRDTVPKHKWLSKPVEDTNNFFLPTSRKVLPILPSWGLNFSDGSSFCPRSSSGQEKGCFGVGLAVFCVHTYPSKGCVTAE